MAATSRNLRFVDVSAALLTEGYGVRFRAGGGSMTPAIGDGDVITVKPIAPASLAPGRVIVYRDCDRVFAHRIVDVRADRTRPEHIIVRGDAARDCDAPIAPSQVLGEVVSVSPRGDRRRGIVGLLQRAAAVALGARRRPRRSCTRPDPSAPCLLRGLS